MAATSQVVSSAEADVELMGTVENQHINAGVRFRLAPGWHIYWRTAGDAGITPDFNWQGSSNIDESKLRILWPIPTRQIDPSGTIQDYVYNGNTIIPVIIPLNDSSQPTDLKLSLHYAACKDICVPLSADLSLSIPANGTDPHVTTLLTEAMQQVPKENGTLITSHSISVTHNTITIQANSVHPWNNPEVFVEGTPDFRFLKPTAVISADGLSANFTIAAIALSPKASLPAKPLHITIVNNGAEAVETDWPTAIAKPAQSPAPVVNTSLLTILLFAFLGGLILNVMPCVLPVLSIKLLSILKAHSLTRTQLRMSFIASAAGIITSFLILAACLILLQHLGRSVGFGFQFQQPEFVTALIIILVIFASNMIGSFEITLPSWLGTIAAEKSGGDAALITSHFLTGAFATLLATPCTAPFLGTAISFALSHPPEYILGIFAVMGIGLSTPYLIMTLFPGSIILLPKPGEWMTKLRYFLGILLFGTAIWLIYVIAGQLSMMAAFMLLGLCLLIKFFLEKRSGILRYHSVRMVFLCLTIALAFYIPPVQGTRDQLKEMELGELWKPFDQDAIEPLVASGQIVVVDVTADWCLSCKINKFWTWTSSDVVDLLSRHGITTMRADITTFRPEIHQYLRSFNRFGIPFNVVYGPKAPQGIVLPIFVKEKDIIRAMIEAGYQPIHR